MLAIIKNYQELLEDLPHLIKRSKYKQSYIIEYSGVKQATFYRKLKEGSFTPEELFKICTLLQS